MTRRLLVLPLILLPLGACSSTSDAILASSSLEAAAPTTLARQQGGEAALAWLPPEAGSVVAVNDARNADGRVQTVTLAGETDLARSNFVRVEVVPRGEATRRRIAEATIAAELADEFPDVAMTIADAPLVAAGSPMAYATGRSASGMTCLYGWQNRSTGDDETPLARIVSGERTAYSLRVRLCRHGVSADRFAATVEGLRFRGATTSTASIARPAGADALAEVSPVGFAPARGFAGGGYGSFAGSDLASPPSVATRRPAVAEAPVRPAPTPRVEARVKTTTPASVPAPAAPAIAAEKIPLPSGG
jgi:hypothetical protein